MIENGIMRGAILMLALGEDEAAEVMKYLGPREVQKLGAAMAYLLSRTSRAYGKNSRWRAPIA